MSQGGNRIIWVCGVIALLIFIASIVSGIVAHKKLRDFHLERYATLTETLPKGTALDQAMRTRLQDAGYQLTGANDVPEQPYSVYCHWIEEGKIKRIQSQRLGCPIYAEIQCDSTGKVKAIVGHEE